MRASHLLHFCPLGDTKPFALIDEMLALLGDHSPCLLFEQLFLERMPEDIRIQLVDAKIDNHRQLAKRADALWSSRDTQSLTALTVQRRPLGGQKHKPNVPEPNRLWYYHRTFGEVARQCRQPCTWLERQDKTLVALATGHSNCLLFFSDLVSKWQFLVDTGAEVSVLPTTGLDTRTRELGPSLLAANGTSIRTFRTRNLPLHIASNTYQWNFIIAEVTHPLLGADFLRANSLLVDLKGKRLVDAATYQSVPLSPTTTPALHPDAISGSTDPYNVLLATFPDITIPNFVQSPTKHSTQHFITTRGPTTSLRSGPPPASRHAGRRQIGVRTNGGHGHYT